MNVQKEDGMQKKELINKQKELQDRQEKIRKDLSGKLDADDSAIGKSQCHPSPLNY